MAVRIEALPGHRRDGGDARLFHRRGHLPQRQLHAVTQRLRARLPVGERGLEAVDHRQERLGEALERIFLRVGRLGLEALARVFGVRQRAQHGVALLLDLGLRLGELLLKGLRAVLCFFRLNALFLHLVELGTAAPHFKRRSIITTG